MWSGLFQPTFAASTALATALLCWTRPVWDTESE